VVFNCIVYVPAKFITTISGGGGAQTFGGGGLESSPLATYGPAERSKRRVQGQSHWSGDRGGEAQ